MSTPNEYTLVEKPLIAYLRDELGYEYLSPEDCETLRGGENRVLLLDHLVDALAEINGISRDDARPIAADLARYSDNERWLALLRGHYSRKLPGEETNRPIKLVDFDDPGNSKKNRFVVTNQVEVRGHSFRMPDVVVYLNGIPLVVIEAKSAIGKQDVFDAIDDICVYEKELPRLFQTNLFNIATNGTTLRYGTTGAPKEFWSVWHDPWPRPASDFEAEPMRKGLWSLLEKGRLLDILAHFVVFEKDEDTGTTVKKMCRYQQYRAVCKIVDRVVENEHRQGLVWHTQGSGKSLTMVFAALKLKFHHGIESPELANPNILVVTDRKNLDLQITKTFRDCGIPNPEHADSIQELRTLISGTPRGKVVLSTIFKAYKSTTPVENSADWIILVDEAHRTQEKDLGAYLRATFPDARRFGFTGTPVKTNDLDTRENFGAHAEDYLDRYSIDDAVRDGATVPICYMSRVALWDLDAEKVDVLFDQEFAGLPEEFRDELKARGVTRGDLARFEPRIELIAYDIWTHFKANLRPDGLKAQIVAADRKACTLYKRLLDEVIAQELISEGLSEAEAYEQAAAKSVCVYSDGGKDDLKPGNEDLHKYYLDEDAEKTAIRNFNDPEHPLGFLIVCNKLLTGFDAPIEQAMYLDSYLVEHNLLQAIARTNRRYGAVKDHGLIVDYIGVTKDLQKALSSYRPEDVAEAMDSDSKLIERLESAHKKAMAFLKKAIRSGDPEQDAKNGVDAIGSEDTWFRFRFAAAEFLRAHAAVGSAPKRLEYNADLKYVASVIAYGKLRFEQQPELDFKEYSEKIRGMLKEHLHVTGLETLLELPEISDPSFWYELNDDADAKDLETAALKKSSALKAELSDRKSRNPAQYATLSARIEELIEQFKSRQIAAASLLQKTHELQAELFAKDVEFEQTGLDQQAHGFYAILSENGGDGPVPSARREFTERGVTRMTELFASWMHPRCRERVNPFEVTDCRAALGLLATVASATLPGADDDEVSRESALDIRVVLAPNRLVAETKLKEDELTGALCMVSLGVEPFLSKVLSLLEPESAKEVREEKLGIGGIITKLKQTSRIPYDLNLTSPEFESLDGWADRSAYNNAVRDVVQERHEQAHDALVQGRDSWQSAMVVMLGVVEQNKADLEAALASSKGQEEENDVAEPRSQENEAAIRAVAEELKKLYTDDDTAPVNWQKNVTAKRELKRQVKRKLKPLKLEKSERDRLIHAITEHGVNQFAKTKV